MYSRSGYISFILILFEKIGTKKDAITKNIGYFPLKPLVPMQKKNSLSHNVCRRHRTYY